ncbi:hypothetical protein J5N97_019302 [Dioscorea zingiberensis]|uniref:BTB domain-containing protein n=1 Tax=Dioscorea zingiberensis TaxID=325984 RepID=A0A9D5HCR1_9LILI|nr:hypothetical protein J5N97_019302 [Dioscorea zingiberensis]
MELSHSSVATALSDSATSDGGTAAAADEALRRLSDHFATLLLSPDHADAFLVIIKGDSELEIPVHRCVLAARSPFFKLHFSTTPKEQRIKMKDLVSGFDVGFDSLSAVLGYLYSGCVRPLPMEAYACADEDCPHHWCRPVVNFALGVLCTSLKFEIPELVSMYQRLLIDILGHVEIDDVLLIFSVITKCNDSSKRLYAKCIKTVASFNLDIVTLEKALPQDLVKKVMELRPNPETLGPQSAGFPAHVKKIYNALDSHDFELVKMLLEEGNTSLDDTYALHYAVSYCDEKFVTQLLDHGNVDVNRRNIRGYTVLHCAAMRKEPQIILSVLTKGARKSEVTPDRRNALQILKRLTKHVDCKEPNDQGKPSTKDQLCIRILEAPEKDSLIGGPSISFSIVGDDQDLELRVRVARILFPSEAKLAMKIAKKGGTLEFLESRNLSETEQQQLLRKEALSRTVELGRNYFPQCSAVVDKYLDNGTELDDSEHATMDGRRKRFYEIHDEMLEALYADASAWRSGRRKKAAKR